MKHTEELLYYIWKHRYFDHSELKTTSGESLQILQTGIRNQNAGPDFLQTIIKIGQTTWAGNAEMHMNASEWNTHRHETDEAYNTVILHVVWTADAEAFNQAGLKIPCLELHKRADRKMLNRYQELMQNEKWVPCAGLFLTVNDFIRESWSHRLMAERLETKAVTVRQALEVQNQNWEEVCFQKLARALGTHVNGDAMEVLASCMPLQLIQKHKDQLLQVEALLFGQSGLLEGQFEEDYPCRLQAEYSFLKNKYQLRPMNAAHWKFLRLRPANFPTIRIAQLAKIIFSCDHLFSKLMAARSVKEIIHTLDITLGGYWADHYSFKSESRGGRFKKLGRATIQYILINAVAPLLFCFGESQDDIQRKEKAIAYLQELPAESNSIVSGWIKLGWQPVNALHSQAQIQLKTKYCDEKKCLQCSIGHQIMKFAT